MESHPWCVTHQSQEALDRLKSDIYREYKTFIFYVFWIRILNSKNGNKLKNNITSMENQKAEAFLQMREDF